MKKIIIVYYRALDHFTTNDKDENECIQEGVGILEEDGPTYLKLKTLDADIQMKDSAKEYNNVLVSSIIYRKDIEIEAVD